MYNGWTIDVHLAYDIRSTGRLPQEWTIATFLEEYSDWKRWDLINSLGSGSQLGINWYTLFAANRHVLSSAWSLKGKCTIRMIWFQNELIHVTFQIRPPPNLFSSGLPSNGLQKWTSNRPEVAIPGHPSCPGACWLMASSEHELC